MVQKNKLIMGHLIFNTANLTIELNFVLDAPMHTLLFFSVPDFSPHNNIMSCQGPWRWPKDSQRLHKGIYVFILDRIRNYELKNHLRYWHRLQCLGKSLLTKKCPRAEHKIKVNKLKGWRWGANWASMLVDEDEQSYIQCTLYTISVFTLQSFTWKLWTD